MKAASRLFLSIVASVPAALILPGATPWAATTSVIYSFGGGQDGEYADTDLIRDGAGNLYGTTVQGGDYGGGTVWQLHPNGDGSWSHSVLYSFTGGADGGEPYKGVTLDAQGNLYGTAVTGGGGGCEGGCGVAYKLTNNGGVWTQSVVHAFTGGEDGAGPGAGLTLDDKGNVYGMAPTGGANGAGTIFRIHPGKGGKWKFTVIHAFAGGDGIGGSAGRLLFQGRRLYGAATAGGANGYGDIYRLTPTKTGDWSFETLYSFLGTPDAGFPYGGLTFDALGNLYGTTYYDGAHNLGAVYELSPARGAVWKERVLYSFMGGADGQGSIADVNFDAAGNLYSTTSEGGTDNDGTIFKLVPGVHHKWTESVVHSFAGAPDGEYAYNGMVSDGAGNLYGATVHGGDGDDGAIYKFTP